MHIKAFDLHSIFWRHAKGAAGKDLGAPYELSLQTIRRLAEGADRVVIACDSGKPSFRAAIDPAYKSNRPVKDPAHVDQLLRLRERLLKDGHHVLDAVDGAEADDVIGTVVAWARSQQPPHTVTIVSSDKDLCQLVGEGVDVQKPDSGEVFDEVKILEKFGVPPAKIVDVLALAGDASDNYKPFPGLEPGKPGIGEKGAVDLVSRFGSATGVIDALSQTDPETNEPLIKGNQAEVLKRGGIAAALRGLALATIKRDVAIDCASILEKREVQAITEPKRYGETTRPSPTPLPASQQREVCGEPVAFSSAPERHTPVHGPTTALARVELDPLAIQPHSMSEVYDFASCAFDSRCYTQFQNVEQVMMAIMEARERRVPVGAALRGAYIVQGKLAWSASFLASLVLNSGKAEVFEIVESDGDRAVLAYKRFGRPEREFMVTIAEARAAGWVKPQSKWATNPRTMLRWFAIREAARAFFPDVVSGMYTPDELRDGVVMEAEFEDAT